MDTAKIKKILTKVWSQEITIDLAMESLRELPFEDFEGFAKLDLHRDLRQGVPEVVLCDGKTPKQVVAIMRKLSKHHDRVMGTRASQEIAEQVITAIPETNYDPISRLLTINRQKAEIHAINKPYAAVVSGGTSDIPVAEEAAQTIAFFGSRVERAYDVGVAGIHRLLGHRELLFHADVVVSVAGMEGALTSVVGGLVSCPVIGVPTSVGYGANFQGLSALLSMLNSCASGVAVVNIDNGFGAGLFAHKILTKIKEKV